MTEESEHETSCDSVHVRRSRRPLEWFASFRWPGIVVATLFTFSGCRVGPNCGAPSSPLSIGWKHPQENDSDGAVAAGDPWWCEFEDPVLNGLMEQAVEANPGLHEAWMRILEARARRGVVRSELFPSLDSTGNYAFKKVSGNSSPYALTSQESYSFFSAGFDAAWELDFWGKYRRAVEAADADTAVVQGDYYHVLLTLLGDVAATYVELRMYQQRIRVAQQNVDVQEQTLHLAEERHRVGLTKPLDTAQATLSLHSTKATIPTLEIGLQQVENRLCVLLGIPPRDVQEQLGVTESIPGVHLTPAIGVPADLLRRRPDVRSAEMAVIAENARIGVAVADLFPQFSLTGTISLDSTDIADLFTSQSITHKIGPSFTWNILHFGRIRSRIAAQETRFEQAVWRYQTVVLAAVEEVENALAADQNERVRLESLELAVEAAQESIRLAKMYYGQGMADFQSVLDSQRSLLSLQDQLTVSRANVTLNRIRLYKALAGGWDAIGSQEVVSGGGSQPLPRTATGSLDG